MLVNSLQNDIKNSVIFLSFSSKIKSMEFEEFVKAAFVKMIYEVIEADGKIHPAELEILNKLKSVIGFDDAFLKRARLLEYDNALVTLYNLPHEQKKALANILDDVAISDGAIHKKEMDLIINTFINIGLGEETE
ncbi:TerB family tellurite resistance protein [Maribacter litoralis]|uniref:TerB family tellurite resistance protein n=1 Tax=Maribacter litoralis TaxID=2059726 RepID=UPI0021D00F4E|nr:TerB family tellurite resistance protein [Maribacter litoralis]